MACCSGMGPVRVLYLVRAVRPNTTRPRVPVKPFSPSSSPHFLTMSAHDNEDLIDYEDEHDLVPNTGTAAVATNGAPATTSAGGEGDKDKKTFSGIHSTGFK